MSGSARGCVGDAPGNVAESRKGFDELLEGWANRPLFVFAAGGGEFAEPSRAVEGVAEFADGGDEEVGATLGADAELASFDVAAPVALGLVADAALSFGAPANGARPGLVVSVPVVSYRPWARTLGTVSPMIKTTAQKHDR